VGVGTGILFDRAESSPDPRWRTIGELAGTAANSFADREFLRFPDERWPATREAFGIKSTTGTSLTFTETHDYSNRLAHVLTGHGVRPGDRVAIMMDNVAGWPLSWLAVLKAGAIAVPVNARYRESDLAFVLADSGAVMVLTTAEHAGLVDAVRGQAPAVREVRTLTELAPEVTDATAAGPAAARRPASSRPPSSSSTGGPSRAPRRPCTSSCCGLRWPRSSGPSRPRPRRRAPPTKQASRRPESAGSPPGARAHPVKRR
jgi:acyl-CoA synthetase (AMP-forming)/AMP-acid ligase II